MCGIVAYLNTDDCKQNLDPNIEGALNLINHRGPDTRGVWIDPHHRIGLGHNRLSIIDAMCGNQPISNEVGDIQLIVNGEFYGFERIREDLEAAGHVFRSKSDSEIAIHLYEDLGLSFLDSLNGEFALCLWDSRKSILICARDRFGVKPLYYTNINGQICIASEMKAFLPFGLVSEWDIDSVVNGGVFFDSRTILKGVKKLPPGHYMVMTLSGSIETHRYWDADYPDKNVRENRSLEEMIDGVHKRLSEAVRIRLRADVPVGIYLSGGIDSSAVLGIASELLRKKNANVKIDAFTISFSEKKNLDESDIAERTAQHLGVNFHKLEVCEKDLTTAFDDCIWHCEAPLCDLNSVAKFLLSRFANGKGFKVVLTGEGSDEHFGGYSFFTADYLREADTFLMDDTSQRLTTLSDIEAQYSMWNTFALRNISYLDDVVSRRMLNGISTHRIRSALFSLPTEVFTDDVMKRTGLPDPCFTMATAVNGIARSKARTKWHPLHTALYIESHTILPNHICNHLGDRTEMAHSIEGRVPFLDHNLTEYVNNLPPSVKINHSINKWILREATKPYITDEVYHRKKHPFIAPSVQTENTPHGIYLTQRLNQEAIEALGWVRWEYVQHLKESFFKHHSRKSINLLNFLLSMVVISEKFRVKRYSVD